MAALTLGQCPGSQISAGPVQRLLPVKTFTGQRHQTITAANSQHTANAAEEVAGQAEVVAESLSIMAIILVPKAKRWVATKKQLRDLQKSVYLYIFSLQLLRCIPH